MSEDRTDRRIERTRHALLQAFVDLTLENGYDNVTVEAVTQRANVGRSTFYVHFRGKEDILKTSMAFPNRELARVLDEATTAAEILPLMIHFYEQRRINRVFFDTPIRPIWVRSLAEFVAPKLERWKGPGPLLPLSLIALQLAELEIGLVAQWLLGRHSAKPQAVSEALLACTRASAAALMGG